MRNLQVFAPIGYQLKEMLKVDMIALLHLSIDTPNGAAKVIADGDLLLKQDGPVVFEQAKRTVYKQNPIDSELMQ